MTKFEHLMTIWPNSDDIYSYDNMFSVGWEYDENICLMNQIYSDFRT